MTYVFLLLWKEIHLMVFSLEHLMVFSLECKFRYPSEVYIAKALILSYLDKKAKPWRILVVVLVKWYHHANNLLCKEMIETDINRRY